MYSISRPYKFTLTLKGVSLKNIWSASQNIMQDWHLSVGINSSSKMQGLWQTVCRSSQNLYFSLANLRDFSKPVAKKQEKKENSLV